MSLSTSQMTLQTANSLLGTEPTTPVAGGTPFPKNTLSDETLKLLEQAANDLGSLNLNQQTNKKHKVEASDANRGSYLDATKAIYLKVKNLHRKKLQIAANMHTIKNQLKQQKFPVQADFRGKAPPNRSEKFKERWSILTNQCKQQLTLLILEDLNEKYQSIKTDIQTHLVELQSHLNPE